LVATRGSSTTKAAATPVRDVSHLGDFTVTPRDLLITAIAIPIGGVSAVVADALFRLIGLTTHGIGGRDVSPSRPDEPLITPSRIRRRFAVGRWR
jgi:hypothetical protein